MPLGQVHVPNWNCDVAILDVDPEGYVAVASDQTDTGRYWLAPDEYEPNDIIQRARERAMKDRAARNNKDAPR